MPLAALAYLPLQAIACSCWHPEPEEYLASARLVFKGKVISVDSGNLALGALPPGAGGVTIRGPQSGMRARFKIDKLWKGNATEEVDVSYTASDGANCGWSFKVGQDVTVFAGASAPGIYSTSMCMMIPFASYTGQGDTRYTNALTAYRARLDGLNQKLLGDPSDVRALRDRAMLFAQYKDFAEADSAYGQVLEVSPRDLPAVLGRANARYETMQYDGALSDFNLALAIQLRHPEAQRGRTMTLVKMGRSEQLGVLDRDFSGFDSGYTQRVSFAGLDLRGANFKGAKLSRVDFSGADLRGADFSEANMHTVNFTDARLERARFDRLKSGYSTSFKGATAQFASFKKANLFTAKFDDAVLVKADFDGAKLESVPFKGASLRGATFRGASLLLADLTGVEWNGQDLSGSDLRGAKLNGAILRGVSLRGAQLGYIDAGVPNVGDWRGADLSSADISDAKWGAVLTDCRTKFPAHVLPEKLPLLPLWGGCSGPAPATTLKAGYERQRGPRLDDLQAPGSQLANRNFSGFGFWKINFDGSDFSGANLSKADFQGGSYETTRFDGALLKEALLLGIDFKGASFSGADLSGARLDRADMSRANLDAVVLRDSCFTATTKWPEGFDALAAGAKVCR